MPSQAALMATIGGNSDPLRRELLEVQRMAKATGKSVESSMGGSHGAKSGVMRETLVLMREISRGNWTRVPGSLSILLSQLGILNLLTGRGAVASIALATAQTEQAAASLLAADSSKLLAESELQEAVSQQMSEYADVEKSASATATAAAKFLSADASRAEALANYEAAKSAVAAKLANAGSIPVLGWVAAALIAVGVAAYFVVRHFRELATETKNLKELLDTTNVKFSEQASALKKAADEAQNFKDWLDKIASSEDTLADKVEANLKALRDRAKLQKEVAESKGASKSELQKMDADELKGELAILEAYKATAAIDLATHSREAAEADADLVNNTKNGVDVSAKSKKAGEIVDEILEQIKTKRVVGGGFVEPVNNTFVPTYRAANADDKMPVKGFPDMSLNEAKAAFANLTAQENKLASDYKAISDLLAKKKKLTESDNAEFQRLTKESSEVSNSIALHKEFDPQIQDKSAGEDVKPESSKSKSNHGFVNQLQQVGAWTFPPYAQVASHADIAKSQLTELKAIREELKKRDRPGAAPGQTQY